MKSESVQSAFQQRMERIVVHYEQTDVRSPRAWFQSHAVVNQLLEVGERTINNPDVTIRPHLLRGVDLPRLIDAYRKAASISIWFFARSKKKVSFHVVFSSQDGKCFLQICFRVESWGHISQVENRP